MTQGSCFALDSNGDFFISNTGYILTGENLNYLLKSLNSKLFEFVFQKYYSVAIGSNGIRWLHQCIENLPIIRDREKIKEFNKSKNENLIYELYELSAEEINYILAQ